MTANPELKVLAEIMRMEEFGPDVLAELASEIVADGGHDTKDLKPQDILDALGDKPGVPWREVAFGIGELFAGYVAVDFKDRKPTKREALKVLMCVTVFGIACRHGQAFRFDNHFNWILDLMARTDKVIWDERLRVLAHAIESWKQGEEQERAQRKHT